MNQQDKATINDEFPSVYLLMSEITNEVCAEAIQWILSQNSAEEKPSCLVLMICSHGGDLNAAMALIDIMRSSTIPVVTVGLGLIASAGLMIFMSGAKGHRVLTENTMVMSHQYSASTGVSKHHELISSAKEFAITDRLMVDLYTKCSGLSENQVRDLLLPANDVWLSAPEAVSLGLGDIVRYN